MLETEDDWLLDSVKSYKNLHMYDLQQPATSVTWISEGRICLGTSNGKQNEILELTLPEKLLADDKISCLSKDRDFKVIAGGPCELPLCELRHLPGSRCVIAAEEGQHSIAVFQLGDSQSDHIQNNGRIMNSNPNSFTARTCTIPDNDNRIVFGSSVDNICLADVNLKKLLRDTHSLKSKDQISGLLSISPDVVLCCCQKSGDLWTLDLRKKQPVATHHSCYRNWSTATWTFAVGVNTPVVCRMSSAGQLIENDLRNLDEACSQLCVLKQQKKFSRMQDFMFAVSPGNIFLSTSGFDGGVHLYQYSQCKQGSSVVEPVFCHHGHSACSSQPEYVSVVHHSWNLWQQKLLLSAGSDGSLHLWEPSL